MNGLILIIILFTLQANGIIIPTVAWVFGWIFFGIFVLNALLTGVREARKAKVRKEREEN